MKFTSVKVSNNALNFLLAQYRAIFKRAYVKGLASAVMLTAALAAGQAQANDITDSALDQLTSAGEVTVDGDETALTISGAATTGTTVDWKANVTVTSGAVATPTNYIQASGGNVTISGTGSLTINVGENEASTQGLAIKGGTGSDAYTTSVTLGKIDVVKGTLSIADGASGSTTVAAGTINIGAVPSAGEDEGVATQATDATQAYVNITTTAKEVKFGAEGSDINVYEGGQLSLNGSTGALKVVGDTLALKTGAILLIDGTTSSIESTNLDIASGAVGVVKGGATGEFAGSNATVDGNLLVGTGATLNLTPASGDNGYGKVTVNGNAQIAGTVKLSQGTLKFTDGAQLHASGTAGGIQVTADSSKAGTLKITKSAFESFLGSGAKFDSIAEDGSVTADGGTSNKGGISLSGNSSTNATLEIVGEGTVVLSDYTFSSGGTVSAGKIDVKSGTIAGNDLEVKEALDDATGLHLRANTLRLGSASYSSTGTDLKIAEAVAKDVILTSDSTGFGVKNAITLDVTLGDDTITVTDANGKGVITGNPVLKDKDKALTIKHGDYTLKGNLTISGGVLTVTNEEREGGNIDTSLVLGSSNTINWHGDNGTDGSKLTVGPDAAVNGVETILDISDAKFNYTDGTAASSTITVQNGGKLIVNAKDQLSKLIASGNTSGTKVQLTGGTLEVVDDLTLTGTQLVDTAAKNTIAFDGTAGGTLQVNGTLAITGASAAQNPGIKANIQAETLKLTNATGSAPSVTYGEVKLQTGNYTVLKSLTSENSATDIQVSGAKVFLGAIDGEGTTADPYNALSTTGTIGAQLTAVNGGTIDVVAGNWRSSNAITITAGELTIGSLTSEGVAKTDAQGNAITAGLTASSLTLGVGNAATVTQVGTLTVEELTTNAAGALNVQGTATINGKYDDKKTQDATDDTYGVSLAAGSVNVGGKVILGADATSAIEVAESVEQEDDPYITIKGNAFTGKVFSVESAGEVQFSFGEDVIFNQSSIADLRDTLFNYDTSKGVIDGFINLGDAQIDGLAVAEDGTVAWDTLKGYTDILADVTTKDLAQAKVTGITDGANVRGNLGSLVVTNDFTGTAVEIDGNLTLNNAAANNGNLVGTANGTTLGLDVNTPADVVLNNGGNIGAITFSEADSSLTVNSAQGTTKIASINGSEADVSFTTGTATVTGTTTAATISTAAGSNTTFTGVVTVGEDAAADTKSTLAGTTTFENTASFANDAVVAGNSTFKANATFAADAQVDSTGHATFAKDVTFEGNAAFYGDTTVEGTANTNSDITIEDDAVVTINNLVTSGNIFVGSIEGDHAGAGTLSVETLQLNGNELVVDPAWDNASGLAFVGVNKFTDATTSDAEAGILNGQAYALQNSILSIGNKNKDEVLAIFDKYINAQGNLSNDKDGVGAIVYVAKTVDVANGGKIVADKTQTKDTYDAPNVANTYNPYGAYIGDNSVLGVEVSAANGAEAAITFADQNVTVAASDSGKIVLTGDYDQSDRINLMADAGDGTVTVANNGTITVETINGLLTYEFNGQAFNINAMTVDTKRAASAFSATSSPVHDSLVAYGTGNTDWRNDGKQTADEKQATKTHGAFVSGVAQGQDGHFYYTDDAGQITSTQVKDEDQLTTVNVLNPEYDPDNKKANAPSKYIEKVVYKAYNPLLSAINNVQANSGISAESAARMADFAGVAQVALKAGNSTSDAISGRMGVGAQNSAITYANNGQGAGLWVTPIYMNSDSDGFEAQGISYGTDINLYGVALGGDYTLANGIRVGAMFNVGSGDVDGQGAGSNVSSDFDYYGFGLYAGYTMGQFSIVGDVSYTAVDNDVEANTEFANIGKLETSLDSSNISLGVTSAYAFDTAAGVKVTPHVGLRYSYIDIDDYTVDSKAGAIGSYSADSLSVFSIPVGVTIASEFNAGSWSVKPSFDVTLTGNFGDDENEGTFHWTGVENIDSSLTSEIFDNFTYGATLGVAAQSASGISLGLSVGYTGSSNVDDFGVNANARFTF